MKKILLILVIALATATLTNAQEIGLRFGNSSGNNIAIDGVFSTGQFNRIHADVSFGGGGVGIDALWDFLYRPIDGEAFNWYVGAGPGVYIGSDVFNLAAVGEVGLEYRFNGVPIALGVDWRPTLNIIETTGFYVDNFGINVRWIFGK